MVKVLSKEFLPDEEKFLNIEKFAPDLDQKKLSKFIQIISSNTLVVNKFEW